MPMLFFLTEQLLHKCRGLRELGIAPSSKKKKGNKCRKSPMQVTAGNSRHNYVYACFQMAQLK